MGYYYYYVDSSIKISKENVVSLEQRLGKSIQDFLGDKGLSYPRVEIDDGNVKNIHFYQTRWRPDSIFCELSPFVENESFIQYSDEEDEFFHFVYQDGKMYSKE
jgi:hypothetical protein